MDMMRCAAVALLFCTSAAAARVSPSQGRPNSETTKTNRIGSSGAPTADWRLDATPVTVIRDSDHGELTQIVAVSRLSPEHVVVASSKTDNMTVYDMSGRTVRRLGRTGAGPGEFQGLWTMLRSADTLIGIDRRGVAQVFRVDGSFLRSEARPGQSARIGYWPSGAPVLRSDLPPRTEAGKWHMQHFELTSRSGTDTIKLGQFPLMEIFQFPGGRTTGRVYDGRSHVAMFRDGFCVGHSSKYDFTCYNALGRKQARMVRERVTASKVTQSDRDIYFAGLAKANPGAHGAQYARDARAYTYFAEAFPAFGRLLASTDGNLWVGPVDPADATIGTVSPVTRASTVWSVYTRDGVWLSDVRLPPMFRLMDAGADYVAGILQDQNDENTVVVFVLRSRSTGRAGATHSLF